MTYFFLIETIAYMAFEQSHWYFQFYLFIKDIVCFYTHYVIKFVSELQLRQVFSEYSDFLPQ